MLYKKSLPFTFYYGENGLVSKATNPGEISFLFKLVKMMASKYFLVFTCCIVDGLLREIPVI